MKRIALLLAFTAAVLGPQRAEAKKPTAANQKTSFTPTNIDTNADGTTATVAGGSGTVKTGSLAGMTYTAAGASTHLSVPFNLALRATTSLS